MPADPAPTLRVPPRTPHRWWPWHRGPAVTVVVPAHNVGRYLGECLDSILTQSAWDRCRVIVVDDGSTDDTAAVADDYASREPRIHVVRQANGGPGPGAARNHGLDLVDTPFVMFVDGDDELAPQAIERLLAGLERLHLDLAVGATEQFPQPRTWPWTPYFVPGELRAVRIEEVPLLVHDARTCNKLYRTRPLRHSRLRFAEGIHHQDTVVNVPSMLQNPKLALVGDVVHRYRKRDEGNSIMDGHYTRLDNYWDHLQVIETLHAMRPFLEKTREPLLQSFIARSFQGFSWRAPETLPENRLREFFDRSAAVVRTLDPAIIEEATRHAGERIAYVTMLEDDLESFRDLPRLAGTLVAHRGDLYRGVPTTSETHRALLKTGNTRALADELTALPDGLQLRIRLRIRGAGRPEHGLQSTELRGLDGDTPMFAEDLHWSERSGEDCIARVVIPWQQLGERTLLLRLTFVTGTGTAARWVRRERLAGAEPAWVAGEQVEAEGRRFSLEAAGDGRARLVVAPAG